MEDIQEFIEALPVGAVFRHYKNKQLYKILAIGRHTEEMQLYVVYQSLYHCEVHGDLPIWIRPLNMFLETVENEGEVVPRFQRYQ